MTTILNHKEVLALHICGMMLLVLWDRHLARSLYFKAGETPTLQESSLDLATPKYLNLANIDLHLRSYNK